MNFTSSEPARAHVYGSLSVLLLLLIGQWALFWYTPWPEKVQGDERIYLEKASSTLTTEESPPSKGSYHPPGYPFLIALCNFFDSNFEPAKHRVAFFQFLMICATLLCFQYLATKAIQSSRRLYTISFLLGIQPWTFAYTRFLYPDSIAASVSTFGLLLLSFSITSEKRASILFFLSLGVLALTTLFRIEMFLLIPLFLMTAAWLKYWKLTPLKFPSVMIILLAVLGIFANFYLTTEGKIGDFRIAKSGAYRWVGTWFATERTGFKRFLYGPITTAEVDALPGYAFSDETERKEIRRAAELLESKQRQSSVVNKIFHDVASKRISENPILHYLLPKIWAVLHIWVNFDLNEQIWTMRQNKYFFAAMVLGFAFLKFAIFLMAGYSAYVVFQRKRKNQLQWYDYVTILMFVYVVGRTLLMGGTIGWIHRYAVPAWPAMMWCAISALFDRRTAIPVAMKEETLSDLSDWSVSAPKIVETTRSHLWILGLLTVAGAFLRIYGLEVQSFWNDELHTVRMSDYSSLEGVIDNLKGDVNSPGYFVFAYFILKFIGRTEWILRFPSVIAGVLCIPAIFLLGRRLLGVREGLIAAAFMTFLWCPIYYSQEARVYSFLLLCSILMPYFWIHVVSELIKNKMPSRFETIAYVIASAVTCYLHTFGILLVALLGMLGLILLRRQRAFLVQFVIIQCGILLAFVPGIRFAILQATARGVGWIQKPDLLSVVKYFDFIFRGPGFIELLVVAALLNLIVRSITSLPKRRLPDILEHPVFFLLLWLIVPFVLIYVVSVTIKPAFVSRYLIILLPAAYLLLAKAITQLPNKIQAIGTALLLIIFSYDLFAIDHYYVLPTKTQFREAVDLVVTHEKRFPDSVVIGNRPLEYYNYYFIAKQSKLRAKVRADRQRHFPAIASFVRESRTNHLWYIFTDGILEPQFMNTMRRKYSLQREWRFRNTRVFLFRVSAERR